MLTDAFTRHPQSVGESYGQHCAVATGFGLRMIAGGLACVAHGFLPFLFERTGSETVRALHNRMVTKRRGPTADSDIAWHI